MVDIREYKVGKQSKQWGEGKSQNITFIVTEDCNLRCKYCYITHKSSNKRLNFETAKKFIDWFFENKFEKDDSVVIDFIGGEPFLEVELIDQICDYFKIRAFEENDIWFWNYRFSVCTNGVNYSDEAVQRFTQKNFGKLSMTITLDGTKEKHDLQRVFPDGSGSYDAIMKNVGLWLKTFYGTTKMTFASQDLKLLKDSIIDLWNHGIGDISANVVFEDVWQPGDDDIFEQQLVELADYIIENELYDKYSCALFHDIIGQPYTKEGLKMTSCGAGRMIALGPDGTIYPCLRYKDYSLNNKKEITIGHVDTGIDFEKVRPFRTLMYKVQSDSECLECDVASGCGFCQGFNYDVADTETNFQRAKYICKMHKARVRANNYYFNKLYNLKGIERLDYNNNYKSMYFILDDNYVDICQFKNASSSSGKMSKASILKGLEFAHHNFFKPVFIHSKDSTEFERMDEFNKYRILHIIPAELCDKFKDIKEYIYVFNKENTSQDVISKIGIEPSVILNVESSDIGKLSEYAKKLLNITSRINLNIQDISEEFDLEQYKEQLIQINDLLVAHYKKNHLKEFNVITDISFISEHDGCGAGKKGFAFAPDENIYLCPAFYTQGVGSPVGNVVEGIINNKNAQLYNPENQPICSVCDVYHCDRCIYLNKEKTNEVNVAPSYKCKKSHIERQIAKLYYDSVGKKLSKNVIKDIEYIDPISELEKVTGLSVGYKINC
ncbi:radical SAM peptide maturase, CXXX-repeat target family [Ruminiclostridium papyrosolvens]|uniref:Radical SAM protein n=1 Tax=Ruminiclostridium papyrosolvens C7 TaxID=1330534 RepID=U4R713_9FIRM|nr:radical SAM peptide maturase, CXXX-repeat target family [Ruminiclostridium papyrosolvens]EPR14575.1 radical SAM protein [Ruminiclostridium papyrosolvens C7]